MIGEDGEEVAEVVVLQEDKEDAASVRDEELPYAILILKEGEQNVKEVVKSQSSV